MMKPRTSGWRVLVAAAALVLLAGGSRAAADTSAVYYRVFLTDGSSLASYGEFARVADRVVFTMPLNGSDTGAPELQLVSLPASAVNWEATELYADAARAAHFAATRGEAEYAALANDVAAALNDMALTSSLGLRLRIGELARQRLAAWARASYGYRMADVAQLSSLLDETIAETRASMGPAGVRSSDPELVAQLDETIAEIRASMGQPGDGARRFDLQLVAMVAPPPPVPMLPPPDARASAQQAIDAARLVDDPGERRSLLAAVARVLSSSEEAWAPPLLASARTALDVEARVDQAYAQLTRTVIRRATLRAAEADVRGVQAAIADVLARDDGLGRRRPAEVSALLATLDARLDAARRLRLARDRWALLEPQYREYSRQVRGVLTAMRRLRPTMDDIRALAGPERQTLLRTQLRSEEASLRLSRVTPPDDLRPVHALLGSAVKLASTACAQRMEAVQTGELQTAWAASSAAAGALMLVERAQEDLTRWLRPPSLP
jgi:hypothetical protein